MIGLVASTETLATTGTVQAAFTKVFVDSNKYGDVKKITKKASSQYAYVTVEEIYQDDGSSSNYKKVNARVHYHVDAGWILCGEGTTVYKGEETKFQIPAAGRGQGNKLRLQAMGNNPALDCKITGVFSTF